MRQSERNVPKLPQFKTTQNLTQIKRVPARSKSRGPSREKIRPNRGDETRSSLDKKTVTIVEPVKVEDDEPEVRVKRDLTADAIIPLRQSVRQLRPVNKKIVRPLDDNNGALSSTQPLTGISVRDVQQPLTPSKSPVLTNGIISSYVNLIKDNIVKKTEAVPEPPQVENRKPGFSISKLNYTKVVTRLLWNIVERHRQCRIQRAFIYLRVDSQSLRKRYDKYTKAASLKMIKKAFNVLKNKGSRDDEVEEPQQPLHHSHVLSSPVKHPASQRKPDIRDVDETVRSFLPKPQVLDTTPLKQPSKNPTPIKQKTKKAKVVVVPVEVSEPSVHEEAAVVEDDSIEELPALMAAMFRKDKCTE